MEVIDRPIWIRQILQSMSVKQFKKRVKSNVITNDYSRLRRNNHLRERHDVFEVRVEMWCQELKDIWVPLECVQLCGEMYQRFMEDQDFSDWSMSDDEDDDDDEDWTLVNTTTEEEDASIFEESDYEWMNSIEDVDAQVSDDD